MTIKERKEKIIEQIHRVDDEAILAQLEHLMQVDPNSFSDTLKELLTLSSQQANLTEHTSAKDLIRQ